AERGEVPAHRVLTPSGDAQQQAKGWRPGGHPGTGGPARTTDRVRGSPGPGGTIGHVRGQSRRGRGEAWSPEKGGPQRMMKGGGRPDQVSRAGRVSERPAGRGVGGNPSPGAGSADLRTRNGRGSRKPAKGRTRWHGNSRHAQRVNPRCQDR